MAFCLLAKALLIMLAVNFTALEVSKYICQNYSLKPFTETGYTYSIFDFDPTYM